MNLKICHRIIVTPRLTQISLAGRHAPLLFCKQFMTTHLIASHSTHLHVLTRAGWPFGGRGPARGGMATEDAFDILSFSMTVFFIASVTLNSFFPLSQVRRTSSKRRPHGKCGYCWSLLAPLQTKNIFAHYSLLLSTLFVSSLSTSATPLYSQPVRSFQLLTRC